MKGSRSFDVQVSEKILKVFKNGGWVSIFKQTFHVTFVRDVVL